MGGNHPKWGVAGGLGPLIIRFRATEPKIQPILGLGVHSQSCAKFVPFWAYFGAFLGYVVELEATKGLFDTKKPSWSRYISFFPPWSGGFAWVLGLF